MFLLWGWNNKCIRKPCVSKIWKSSVIFTAAVGNSWEILNAILGHKYHSNQSNGFISNEWSHNLQQKWVLLQSVNGELSVHDQLFCRHQHWWSLYSVTRKLDLDQTAMAHKHTQRHNWCDTTRFSVRLFTPISNKFCIISYTLLLCLWRFLCLLTWVAQDSCTLWSILRSIWGWFLNFKSLFSNSLPLVILTKFSEYSIN